MAQFFVEGPIGVNQPFIMVYQTGTTLYVLNSYTASGVQRLFFDPSVFNVISGFQTISTVPIFLASGSPSKLLVTIQNLGGALSYTTDGKAGIASAPPVLVADPTPYVSWGPLLLSGIPYTFSKPGGSPIAFDIGTDPGNLTGVVTSPILIPVTWYFGCSNGLSNTASDVGLSICASQCYISPTNPACISTADTYCAGVPTTAWTTTEECTEGTVYSYCTTGNTCGASCKGPCSSSLDNCLANTNGAGYKCVLTPSNLFEGKWWLRPWFIITVIIVVIIGIIIIVFLVSAVKKKKAAKAAKSESTTVTSETHGINKSGTVILTE